jgi:hypothetical protein
VWINGCVADEELVEILEFDIRAAQCKCRQVRNESPARSLMETPCVYSSTNVFDAVTATRKRGDKESMRSECAECRQKVASVALYLGNVML